MEVRKVVTIDMAEFGMEGTVELCEPGFTKKLAMKNALGNCTRTHLENGVPVVDETRLGDIEVVEILSYVRKAPFRTEVDGFCKYCDVMDLKDLGSAERLFEAMSKAVTEIKEYDPFATSQEAVTESSDSTSSPTESLTDPSIQTE